MSDLVRLLGLDPTDPEVAAAIRDGERHVLLIEHLRNLREERGLTLAEVAARMGVTQSWLSDFESLGNDPRLSELLRYARALGADDWGRR